MRGLLLPIVLLGALLTGCAGSSSAPDAPSAWLKPGTRVALPPPTLAQPFSQQQLLNAQVKGQRHTMMVLLNADGQRLTLVGMSPLGIRLFNLVYDEQGIRSQQFIKLGELPPAAQVLADIMLSYWPQAQWQAQLPTGWRLEDRGDRRRLYDDRGALISEIRYQTSARRQPVSISQSAFHYRIAIENLDE
ncbi:DUF3261 domain-containing protein [Serratia sp. JUb9]|uniref:DUF3261 domain-containing protein n=1 Tax=unclassified Serratia (in: enterobacteria) TaxID=2647522 RepID=UPI000CF644BE|nr:MULTISPECIES: DUF3261 domain-containing protein [unclassified Serratia (in: enterobacteria)]AVJ16387.1 hypothetical protein CLM71_04195 [Serratia sp. MYb239]MBU3895328.1 DUF3261 domain-containing protein [Serratia rubidaea]MCA4821946.1 DUF3261 domain-containing protein [Serratia rubidaea]QNK31669.1 DUF3261 domain-containing protein [Serratia sp. JUb9]